MPAAQLRILTHNNRGDTIEPRLALVDYDGYERTSVLLSELRDALAAIPAQPSPEASRIDLDAPFVGAMTYRGVLVSSMHDRLVKAERLLQEAREALIRATNNIEPECIFCEADATPDGDRHAPTCIIARLATPT